MTPTPAQPDQRFDVTPTLRSPAAVRVVGSTPGAGEVDAVAVPVVDGAAPPAVLGLSSETLTRAGFTSEVGSASAFPARDGLVQVAVGVGPTADLDPAAVRDAAAAFARVVPQDARLAAQVPDLTGLDVAAAAAAIVEGVLLARYRFDMGRCP